MGQSGWADLRRELELIDAAALDELARRIAAIDQAYREAAESMGQLYMFADSISARELTRQLDEPMRDASRNELKLRTLLEELQLRAPQRLRVESRGGIARTRRSHR